MAKRIELKPHLSTEELHRRSRSTENLIERARWEALWMLSKGLPREEVARSMGYGTEWVRRVAARYNAGVDQVADGRHRNPGHTPLLSVDQLQELAALLEHPTPEGEPWSGPRVARWMSALLGRPVAAQRGWDYLRKAGFTPQRPRPRHKDADATAQARFPARTAARA